MANALWRKYPAKSKTATGCRIVEWIDQFCSIGQSRNRGDIIKNFQTKPELKVFLGSLLAGGIGIDLTAASVVVHYDRWWNASKENQATDRVHRIGQNKNVQVMKLVTIIGKMPGLGVENLKGSGLIARKIAEALSAAGR